jgi:hypothetical protein
VSGYVGIGEEFHETANRIAGRQLGIAFKGGGNAVDKAGDKQAADLSLRCASDMLCLSPS